MTQPSEQIKEKLDLVDFVKSYVELKPAGRNWKGRCPFHNERTPSFIVSKDRQIWHCFGCGLGGDIFKFLMQYENVEFRDALKTLAEKAGIELRSSSPEEYRMFGVLYDINNSAKEFYIEQSKRFPVAREYLAKRKLKDETMAEFEIGFAPNEFDKTTTYLIKKGFKVDDLVRAGIAFKSEAGRVGDRFRGRIMFPIHDHSGKVVGFSGRILPELESKTDMGKYINSPETPIYNKSKIMYGFWRTKKAIRDSRAALLVEGQMDFLMSYQSGIANVIATSGTALTAEHLKTLKPIADKVVLSFDSDSAGLMAAERAIDILGERDFNVAILNLGEYKDPADAAAADPSFLAKAVKEAKSATNFYFDRYLKGDLAREKKNIRIVLGKIKKLYSAIERASWLRELAHLTGLTEKDLREEMDKIEVEMIKTGVAGGGADTKGSATGARIAKNAPRKDVLSERILGLLSAREDLAEVAEPYLQFMPANYLKAYKSLFMREKSDAETDQLVNVITLRSSIGSKAEPEEEEKELGELLKELEVEDLKRNQAEAQRSIKEAESKGDEAMLAESMKKFDDVSKKMQNIRSNRK